MYLEGLHIQKGKCLIIALRSEVSNRHHFGVNWGMIPHQFFEIMPSGLRFVRNKLYIYEGCWRLNVHVIIKLTLFDVHYLPFGDLIEKLLVKLINYLSMNNLSSFQYYLPCISKLCHLEWIFRCCLKSCAADTERMRPSHGSRLFL